MAKKMAICEGAIASIQLKIDPNKLQHSREVKDALKKMDSNTLQCPTAISRAVYHVVQQSSAVPLPTTYQVYSFEELKQGLFLNLCERYSANRVLKEFGVPPRTLSDRLITEAELCYGMNIPNKDAFRAYSNVEQNKMSIHAVFSYWYVAKYFSFVSKYVSAMLYLSHLDDK